LFNFERSFDLKIFFIISGEELRIAAKSLVLEEGVAVVAKYAEDERWYRALIVSKCQHEEDREDQYNVLYVDYGNSKPVSLHEILPVCQEFCELPMETIPCCLADVIPISRKLRIVVSTHPLQPLSPLSLLNYFTILCI